MTQFQWEVILAIARLVKEIERRTCQDNDEWFDVKVTEDLGTIDRALKGDGKPQ